jgi:hypothetical protein
MCRWKVVQIVVVAVLMAVVGGCSFGPPRVRLGCYATSTPGTRFMDDKGLGKHNYANLFGEGNGIAYTCNGGHIDIAHLRIGVDNTRYIYTKTLNNLMQGDKSFTYSLNVDRSVYHVDINYPDGWKTMPADEKKKIANDVAIDLAQYFTFTMTTWHEVMTWYGFKTMGFVPEQPSAFSWEDVYSNLLGTMIGAEALRTSSQNFNEAVTLALEKKMTELGILSQKEAYDAAEKMRGKWFVGQIAVDMLVRNFDIGLDDGMVTPMLVPGMCTNQEAKSYPVPTTKTAEEKGFKVSLEIEPHEFEKGKVLRLIYHDGKGSRIKPERDMPVIMKELERQQAEWHKKK